MLPIAFLFYALISMGLLAINMPPYQNADETNHFLRADSISRGHLLGRRIADGKDFGGLAGPEIARSGAAFDWPKFYPDRKVTRGEYASAAAKFGAPETEITFPNTAAYPPILYAPSVVAVWIGKASRSSVVQTLYLARLLTGLASGLAISVALYLCVVRSAGGAAHGIFVIATLPMALSLQNAVSQDGPMLAVAAVAAALLVGLRQAPSTVALAGLTACCTLLAVARPPYIFLALLPLAAKGKLSYRLLSAAIIASACLAWSALISRTAGHLSIAANNADMSAQIAVLMHPVRLTMLLADTLHANGMEYANQFVGRLGWLDVLLPSWYVHATLVGLMACLLLLARPFDRGGLIVVCAVLGSSVAVMLLIYFSWTAVGHPVIDGIQGRYFVPLAMVLCALGGRLPKSPVLQPAWVVMLLWPAVSIAVTMRALVVRYYLGG